MDARPVRRPAKIVLQRLDGAMHAALDVGFVDARSHYHSPFWTIVAVPRPLDHLGEVAGLADVEDDDRNIVVAAQGDGGWRP